MIRKSKIFIKAKLTVSKSCLLGPACFLIHCILRDAHLQNLSFLRGISTEFFFSTFLTFPLIPGSFGSKIEIAYLFDITFPRIAIVVRNELQQCIHSHVVGSLIFFMWIQISILETLTCIGIYWISIPSWLNFRWNSIFSWLVDIGNSNLTGFSLFDYSNFFSTHLYLYQFVVFY